MSIAAISWAWEQKIRSTMKFVLVALADFADSRGESCYPGQDTIAAMTGISIRAVKTALDDLEKAGLIERTARRFKGHATTDDYRLFCDPARLSYQGANAAPRKTAQSANGTDQGANEAPSQGANDDISDDRIIIGSVNIDPSVDPNTPGAAVPEADYPDDFLKFWRAFPRKDGKREALKAWQKLTRDEKAAAIADVPPRCANNWAGRETEKIPHASTYLNQKRWEDDIAPNRIATPARVAPDLSPGQELLRQMHSEAVDRERARSDRNPEHGQSALAAPTNRPDGGRGVH
jgi:hypothetical protein